MEYTGSNLVSIEYFLTWHSMWSAYSFMSFHDSSMPCPVLSLCVRVCKNGCVCVSRESSNKENSSSQPGWSFTTVRKKKPDSKKTTNGTVS